MWVEFVSSLLCPERILSGTLVYYETIGNLSNDTGDSNKNDTNLHSFARPARAFFTSVYFFAVVCKTTT